MENVDIPVTANCPPKFKFFPTPIPPAKVTEPVVTLIEFVVPENVVIPLASGPPVN